MSITKRTVRDHAKALRTGEYSARELCLSYLGEIEKNDSRLGAYLTVDRNGALEAADAADKRLRGGDAPLLCGIPYGAKDNICTRGITTTAGSTMLESFIPPYDATVIERLKENGALLLGKTNMDEFGMGSATDNSAYKVTKNPLNEELIPGGSSGGSAAAVAAGLAPFALGSDTGGSVRQPAALCNTVGLCPTYGRVSRYGLIAFASSLDRIGILAKSCEDCSLVFSAISGKDRRDSTTVEKKAVSLSPLKGLKVGIIRDHLELCRGGTEKATLSAMEMLTRAGAECSYISTPALKYSAECYYIISSAEASSNLARYDGVRFGKRSASFENGLSDFYCKNRSAGLGDEVKRRIMFGTFTLSEGFTNDTYKKALSVRTLIKEEYNRLFSEYHILLSPTVVSPARLLSEKESDPAIVYAEDLCTVSQSLAGLPALSVPLGTDQNGMPLAVQLTGKAFSEELLLFAGSFLEGSDGRKGKEK